MHWRIRLENVAIEFIVAAQLPDAAKERHERRSFLAGTDYYQRRI
jgi:hypothetical protein